MSAVFYGRMLPYSVPRSAEASNTSKRPQSLLNPRNDTEAPFLLSFGKRTKRRQEASELFSALSSATREHRPIHYHPPPTSFRKALQAHSFKYLFSCQCFQGGILTPPAATHLFHLCTWGPLLCHRLAHGPRRPEPEYYILAAQLPLRCFISQAHFLI